MNISLYQSVLPPLFPGKVHIKTLDNMNKWVTINDDINIEQKIFKDNDCINFLKEFSDKNNIDVLKYYLSEPDGRFKSDIWRLCILHEYGGLYVDIDQEPLIKISEYLELTKIDFCASSSMFRDNISNGFLYTKKGSNIMMKCIIEFIRRYDNRLLIGGTWVMGKVIEDLTNETVMPIGEIEIGDENCLFLQEIGDYSIPEGIEHYNSFGIFTKDGKRVMNSRYSTYKYDVSDKQNFIEV